ncbi:MAG: RNA methyltransferase [Bacteroidales bacterium]|nr:RNA methyltransferase [Bacteroidales bacterium]MDD4669532.1 RNA methyltransferase [Bacteroidales bacterium]
MFRKLFNNELNRISVEEFKNVTKTPIVLILDNIRSQHNIGAAFRTSDAFCLEKIYLCGICATPPTPEIHKSALGAEFSMDWEYADNAIDVVRRLKSEGYVIVSVEQAEHSTMLHNFTHEQGKKYAYIFGNEVKGVQQEVVDESDLCVEIPQFGTKHSLNVSVSIGVVLWEVTRNDINRLSNK